MTVTGFTGQEARPDFDLIASDAIRLESLIEAMDGLTDRLGPDSGPVYACIASALPIAKRISRQLDNLSAHTGTAVDRRADSSDGIHEAGPDSGNGSDALWTEIRALAGVARAHVEPVKTD
jgi:hypothetical protein